MKNEKTPDKYKIIGKEEKMYEPSSQRVIVYTLENVEDGEEETCIILQDSSIFNEFERANNDNQYVELNPALFKYVVIPYDEDSVITVFFHNDVKRDYFYNPFN